jgi:hypothetical protein
MNPRLPVPILAVAAAAIFAACSGGGGGSSSLGGSNSSIPNGNANAGSQPTSGVWVTLSINSNANAAAARAVHTALRVGTAQSRRSPQFVSYGIHGLQLTVASGSASQTLYYAIGENGPFCQRVTNYSISCTLSVPTLGPTETVSAIEVNQAPTNVTAAGTGTGFPSNSGVLARGSTSVTLNAGGVTNVALSMNPVLSQWYDCGFDSSNTNMNEDGSTRRIVVTANVASSNVFDPEPSDYAGYTIFSGYTNGNYVAQPFIDVNASPVPASGVSNSQHLTLIAFPGATPSPAPPYAYAVSASIPDTSFVSTYWYGLQIALHYDGQATSASTLTFANNLTATPPPFLASPNPSYTSAPASYAASYALAVVPISVSPATLNGQANDAVVGTVTASDAGANQSMGIHQCMSSTNQQLATVTSNGAISGGSETFTVTAGFTAGTCTFTLNDYGSNVVTNAVTVNLTPVP